MITCSFVPFSKRQPWATLKKNNIVLVNFQLNLNLKNIISKSYYLVFEGNATLFVHFMTRVLITTRSDKS